GFALTQSAAVSLAIFLALGLGFALPFVALGYFPGAFRILPRSGPWMTTLRQALAFPMYGAAIWLLWVLSFETGSDGVFLALTSGLVPCFGLLACWKGQGAGGM